MLTTSSHPPELTVSDDELNSPEDMQQPIPQRQQPKFHLDDAFSVHDDETSATFDFDSDYFMKELQARTTIGAQGDPVEDWDNASEDAVDLQDAREVGYGSTPASVSTLDINAPADPRHSLSTTPPPASSSSQSMNSEGPPTTPSDKASTSPSALTSQFTDIALSFPHIPLQSNGHEPENAYPNVIIDASEIDKNNVIRSGVSHLPSSTLYKTSDSTSSASDPTIAPSATPQISISDGHRTSRSLSSSSERHSSAPAHRPTVSVSASAKSRSDGPSTFQKVLSKTRPSYLPPKQKEEDDKHSKEWEEMMHRSRMAEQKRREELQGRRIARELSVEANMSVWQRTILPDWKKALKDPDLRKLWWEGIPTKLRSTVWERAIGNGLQLSKDSYTSSIGRARSLLASRRFPTTALSMMEADIASTLPQLHIFNRLTGPLYTDLRDLLCAWIVSRADEGLGYVEGIAKIGGMLLLQLTGPAQAFVVMRNLLERSCLRAFYGGAAAREDVEAYYRIFDTLLADGMPKIYFNFKQHQISPSEYLPDWLLPLFLNHLPLEACSRIWDVLVLEGDAFLFRAALALLASIESRLFFPDRKELLEILKGESRAALEVAKRDARTSPRGDKGDLLGPRYEIYGVNEETIWERVIEMTDWWKESTWQRLIVRELPDL